MIVVILIGFVLANFLYQAFTTQNWESAFERTYFQITASIITWWILK